MKIYKNLILIILLFFIDLLTKFYFIGKKIKFFSFLYFNYTRNSGIIFGLFKNNNLFFIILTLVIIFIVLYYYRNKNLQLGFDFVLAGAFGNLFSRIYYGHVIDFIDFKVWPIFNLADMFVVIGVLYLIIKLWKD